MFILFGLISTVLVLLVDYLIMLISGSSLSTLSLWFIIPIGGLAEGALCGLGAFIYLMKKDIKASAKHYILSAFIAFIGFWAINYFTYASTYIDEGKINNIFQGEHISNYYYNDNEAFTFKNYLNFTFQNSESTFGYKNPMSSDPVNLGTNYNQLSFYLSLLAFTIGGLGIGRVILGNKVYCDKCNRYLLEKELYKFDYNNWDEEVNALQYYLQDSKEKFENFINIERQLVQDNEPFFNVVLYYCPSCKDGFIILKCMMPKKDSYGSISWEEDDTYSRRINLENKVSSKII